MIRDRRPAPDGESSMTGASDPYLANLAEATQAAAVEGPSVAPEGAAGPGAGRVSDAGVCYDPYLVEVARSIRGDF